MYSRYFCNEKQIQDICRSKRNPHLVDVGPLSLHDVILPLSRVSISVRVRHLAGAGFFSVCVGALVRCVQLVVSLKVRAESGGGTLGKTKQKKRKKTRQKLLRPKKKSSKLISNIK